MKPSDILILLLFNLPATNYNVYVVLTSLIV